MTEQQYRVIADRDKGDDPQWYDAEVNHRVTATVASRYPSEPRNAEVVRIERPVPTTDVADVDDLAQDIRRVDGAHSLGAGALAEALTAIGWTKRPSVPTRKQIAEALRESDPEGAAEIVDFYYPMADALLALLNGADR